ncbi:MAG: uL15m family ribosomal protein, partial [Candidatus Micrarchaeota archaeon]
GMHKHKFSWATTYDREWMAHGGRRGFSNPTRKKVKTLNVYHIQNMAQKGKLEASGAVLKLRFEGKILGTGELTQPVEVSALSATKKAIERIEQAGGKFISLARTAQEKEP